jgi:hypothetical protein
MAGSGHKRTNNNAKRTSRLRKLEVEKILEHLPDDIDAEFKKYARYNQRSLGLIRWLVEAQEQYHTFFPSDWKLITPTVSEVTNWVRKWYPVGERAQVLNELTSAYVGLDYDQVIESSLAQSVSLCMKLTEQLDNEGLADVSSDLILQQVSALQRTISILYKDLHKAKERVNVRDAEMAGAQRIVDILLNQFKDQAGESAIKQACIGALEQVESEIYGTA